MPLIKETGIVILCLSAAPHIKTLVHDYESAGTDYGAYLSEILIIKRNVYIVGCYAASGRTAQLDCLDLLISADTSSDIEDDMTQSLSHGDLYQAAAADLACEGKYLRTLAAFGSHGSELLELRENGIVLIAFASELP